MKLISTALILLIAVAGCREVITGPELPDPNPTPGTGDPSTPSESEPHMYLKGPEFMIENDAYNFRGEPLYGVNYEWHWFSPDGGAIQTDDLRTDRVFDATAVHRGTVTITMTARDDSTGRLRGVGRKTVEIYPFGTPETYPGSEDHP